MKTTKKDLGKSQVEIDFELTAEEFSKYIDKALEHLKSHVKMDGFRPGSVPKEIAEKKIGQENLLTEAGDLAVKESYQRFVNENNLEPIGQPQVQIKKIARGSEFVFKVIISVLPEIKLPDYKKIALQVLSGQAKIEVDEKEIEDTLNYLQKSRAKFTDKTTGAEKKDYIKIEYQNESINGGKPVRDMFILGEGGFLPDFENNLLGMEAGEEKEFTVPIPKESSILDPDTIEGSRWNRNKIGTKFPDVQELTFKVKMLVIQTMELPEINDEFAKSIGVFDSLVALKSNLKEGITMEKKEAEKQRKRGDLLDKIAEKLKVELPEKLVEYEQTRLFESLKSQIAQNAKVDFDEYLKSIKKSEEEIKKSFRLEAEKRIKDYLILKQVGKDEKIEVSKEEIEDEINKMIKSHSKEQLDKIDINRLKEYSKDVIYNEKVFQKLDQLSNKNSTAH